jgi:hypothetical protein
MRLPLLCTGRSIMRISQKTNIHMLRYTQPIETIIFIVPIREFSCMDFRSDLYFSRVLAVRSKVFSSST